MQALIYGANLYSELNHLRQQYDTCKDDVFYFSKGITQIEQFIEFFFEILNENADPLVFAVEVAKSISKLKEYSDLRKKEKMNTYIDLEAYKEMKKLQDIRENHFQLMRSKKKLPKIKNFKYS